MSEGVDWINNKLKEDYGTEVSTGQPNFRLTWSTSQVEKRYNRYERWTESGIYLKTEEGVFEEPKYPWEDMWVLERLQPTAGNPYIENICKLSYEPVWVFGVGNSSRQPIWRGVKLLVDELLRDKSKEFLTHKDVERLEREQKEKETKTFKMMLQNDTPFGGDLNKGTILRP